MKDRYLEVTYRNGRPLAAYLYLSKNTGIKSAQTKKIVDGLIADFDSDGNLIGIEIISPHSTTVSDIKTALAQMNIEPISENELAPLKAA